MQIKAFLPASLIEFPGCVADVLFVGACNFRCPYCYNVDLVLHAERLPDLEPAEVLHRLEGRVGFVDGVVVSGGEPSLQHDLIPFLADLRRLGLAVKLDTNGYRPDVLAQCLGGGLLDYVAMDIKSSLNRYEQAAGVSLDVGRLRESVELLLGSSIDYEFRTTVVPTLVERQDVEAIGQLIAGAKRYYLQRYRPAPSVGWGQLPTVDPPTPESLQEMAGLVAGCVQQVDIRGL